MAPHTHTHTHTHTLCLSRLTSTHGEFRAVTCTRAALLKLFNRTFCAYSLRVKLSPKCSLCFFCDCIWVRPLCKSTMMLKEAPLRFTVLSFSAQTHFQWECMGHFYASIKIAIFKTLRRLDTTWNFACSITRVSTHEHEHWEHSLSKRKLLNNSG